MSNKVIPMLLLLVACGGSEPGRDEVPESVSTRPIPEVATEYAPELGVDLSEMTVLPSGLRYRDDLEGDGASAVPGHRVTVHYTGWLSDGTQFDSSRETVPFDFVLGGREVIRGWDEGVAGMKVGGKRTLVIPEALAYVGGRGPIPAGATIVFEVELMSTGN